MKMMIWIGAAVGSTAGGWLGSLLDGSMLGAWSILLGTIGGVAGIYAAFKLNQRIGE